MLLFLATGNPKRWRFYSLVTRLLRDQIQYGGQCAIPRSNAKFLSKGFLVLFTWANVPINNKGFGRSIISNLC